MISLLGEAAVSAMGSVGVHRSMISWSASDNDVVAVVVACRVGGVGVIGIVPKEIIFTGVIGIVPVDTIVGGSIEFERMTRGCRSTIVSIIR
jgi:hypothetical protein